MDRNLTYLLLLGFLPVLADELTVIDLNAVSSSSEVQQSSSSQAPSSLAPSPFSPAPAAVNADWSSLEAMSPPTVVTAPAKAQATAALASATNRRMGEALPGLAWRAYDGKGIGHEVDLSSNQLGGIPLRPSDANQDYRFLNPQHDLKYETLTLAQYEQMSQDVRKCALYGRLLHFGAWRAFKSTGIDTSKIIHAIIADPDLEIAVVKAVRTKSDNRSKGLIFGAFGLGLGYIAYAVGSAQVSDCSSAGYYSVNCSTHSLSPELSLTGLAAMVIGLAGTVYFYTLQSPEEVDADARIRAASEALNR